MKEHSNPSTNFITDETPGHLSAELSLAYKQLQENKLLIQHLADENRNLKKELQALKKIITATKQSRQHLLAGISHEIRSPLNAIVGLSSTLKDITDENDRKEQIETIENSALVLGTIVSNIIEVSEIDSQKIKLNVHPFQPRALIKNLQTTFSYRLKGRPIEFKTEVDDKLPEWVKGDEQKILYVLFSLLNISEKFTESGMIKLSLNVANSFNDNILVDLSVEDTGKWLYAEDPSGSYTRFDDYIEKKAKLSKAGLAFGFPIKKTLLKLLKGEVKIESNPDADPTKGNVIVESKETNGTKITIAVPLKLCSEAKGNVSIISVPDDSILASLNILIAEDTELNRKYLSILLKKWNIVHTFVSNGNEAIEKINTLDFDLVLMDINMPVLNGFETTQIIRKMKNEKKSSVPVIGVSASVLTEYKLKGKAVGMNYFLSKPFKPEDLKELLIRFAIEKQTKNTSVFNKNASKDYFGNDYAAAAQIFKVFIEELLPQINNWEELLEAKGIKELKDAVHATKPALEMIGLTSLSEKCFDLEQACSYGVESGHLKEKIEMIKTEVKELRPHIIEEYQVINKLSNKND